MKISVLGLCGHSIFLEIDHFPTPGETVHASGLYTEPGGKGFNQAVAAARLGAQVTFFSCVGEDEEGRNCIRFLEHEGIRPSIQVRREMRTACASILTDKTGENRITVYQGAAKLISANFIHQNEKLIAESDLLLLNNEYPAECNIEAVNLAEKYNIPVILNPAPAYKMDIGLLKKCFIVTPNLTESAAMFGEKKQSIENLPAMFRRHGIKRAAITLGADGALLIDGSRVLKFPARPFDVKDTTGAGDTFNAALAVEILRGEELPLAVEYAINASALSVSKKYVMPSLPTRDEVKLNYLKLVFREVE